MSKVTDGTGLQVGPLDSGHWPLLGELFEEIFEHPLDPALLRWKYAEGRGLPVGGLNAEGKLVGHCGVVFRRLLAGGVPARGALFSDLMVSTRVRGQLTRERSPIFQVISELLDEIDRMQPPTNAYGFPSGRAGRVIEHLKLGFAIDQLQEVVWPALSGAPEARRVTGDARAAAWADRLWQPMARDLNDALVVIRDGAYLLDRYIRHPLHTYELYLLTSPWLRRPLGLYVLRQHGDWVELMDWIGPLNLGERIITDARKVAAEMGANRLMAWFGRAHVARYGAEASSVTPTQFRVIAPTRMSADWQARFQDRLWLSTGDAEYR